jgi:lysophospholipase L1-like esterase
MQGHVLKGTLILVSAVGLSLVGSELFLQVFHKMDTGRWLSEQQVFHVGYTQAVNDRRQYSLRPGYVDRKERLSINEHGFRGPLIGDDVQHLIVVIGDSVPFGTGVSDDETYPAVLESLLRQSGHAVRVLNAAVPSYNLRQSFDRLRMEVLTRYRSPLVVLVQAANDVSLATQFRESYTPDVTWAEIRWRNTWPQASPRLFPATQYYVDQALARLASGPTTVAIGEQHVHLSGDKMIRNVENVLREALSVCGERGIQVVLLPVDPFYYQTRNQTKNGDLPVWKTHHMHFDLWDDLIRRLNQILADVNRTFPKVFFFDTRVRLDGIDREKLYLDFLHYTPMGNRVIAEQLAEFLHQRGLLPKAQNLVWRTEQHRVSSVVKPGA